MPDRMQQFLEIGHEMPAKRPTDERRHDFLEIYAEYGTLAGASRRLAVSSAASHSVKSIARYKTTYPTG